MMSAWTLYQCRRYEESVTKARKAMEMSRGLPQAMLHLGNSLIAVGELDEAVAVLRQSAEAWGRSGMPRFMLAHARAAQGKLDAANEILEKLLVTAHEHYMKPFFVGITAVAADKIDLAFEWFRKAVVERNEWLLWFATEPKLDPIRHDPRYHEILAAPKNPIALGPGADTGAKDTAEPARSIAILPFKLIKSADTGGSEDDYLGIGLADSVTMRLSNVRKFIVRPTSSVMQTTADDTDPFNAGDRLGVEFVVDGIIRHVGDKIRVTAQLLDVKDRATLWSAGFVEKTTDLLELEDSIASQVTKNLLPKLTGEEAAVVAKGGTKSPEAHDAYLQGRYFWNQLDLESFPKAISAFRRAVELDPEYALAHVGIADYFTWASIYGIEQPNVGFPQVLESASRALDLDPSLAEAYAALGLYYSNAEEWDRSEQYYRKGLEINPNYPLGHEWLAAVLVGTGRFDEGVKEILLAEGLDPLSLRPKVLSAWTLYQAREYDAAIRKAREIEALDPDFMQAHLQSANVLLELGENESALHHARRAAEIEPGSPLPLYVLTFALVANDLLAEANEVVEAWYQRSKEVYVIPYLLALSYEAIGDRDRAVELIRQAIDEKNAWILWLGTEPKLVDMRQDGRYREVL
jgi:tetratricopeptide (TPR) repeat protein